MATYDEYLLLDGLRNLDSQSIGTIYDRYFSEVYRYVRYRLNDDATAEDITSEVFVRLLESAHKNQGPQVSLKGWLISTASHALNDHLRRQYRRPVENLSESLPDDALSVHAQVDLRAQHQIVKHAYDQLTREQQDVIALRFGQGYSLEETATQMKKNLNAVKALQFRALASLQRRMMQLSQRDQEPFVPIKQ